MFICLYVYMFICLYVYMFICLKESRYQYIGLVMGDASDIVEYNEEEQSCKSNAPLHMK